jgi:beta-glucosidase
MGAEAIVDVLFGDYNPSGILPFTYPAHSGDILTYDHKFLSSMVRDGPNKKKFGGYHPEYKFGHGLSYSKFKFDNFKISHDTINIDDTLFIDFDITNTSDLKATKLIDLFIKDLYASYSPDVRNLKAFTKVTLAQREKKHITMSIDKNSLFFYSEKGEKIYEKGIFSVMIENESRSFYLDL